MFETLHDGLYAAFKSLRGKGKLTEANMREGLRIVEQSMLEADVSYSAVQAFMQAVTDKALGERVLDALNPSQQLFEVVYRELVELLGPVGPPLTLNKEPTVLMMCGLQGAGKTTTCGKLAKLMMQSNVRPMLVAADLQRPAAIDQLHVLGEQLGIPVYSERGSQDPVQVCQNAVKKARDEKVQAVILDTAGRLAIDQELMDQLVRIEKRVGPDQVFLVVDGMTGQDAVNSAKAFNEALELDGVVMTKLDGDARGGALLSVKHVTGVPIKFIGTGEQLEGLEPFRPEGMAERILGQGDIVELARQARQVMDEDEQRELERKMAEGQFTLDDFKSQLEKFARPGLMQKMMGLMPGMGELSKMMSSEDGEAGMRQTIGIINAMTKQERRNPKLIDQSRRNRIARGSGTQPQDVNQLIKQYDTMAPIMQAMAGKGPGDRMRAIQQLQKSLMSDPTGGGIKTKKGTGKRLTPKERAKLKKQREKDLRRRRRGED